MGCEQRLDLGQVATLGRVINRTDLITADQTDQYHHDQRGEAEAEIEWLPVHGLGIAPLEDIGKIAVGSGSLAESRNPDSLHRDVVEQRGVQDGIVM